MTQIVCMGELLVDFVSERDVSLTKATSFLKAPGGAPANVAVGLVKLGVDTAFVGQVGCDPFGDWLKDVLHEEGVDISYLRQSPDARTTLAFIATRSDGKKDICFYRNPGADALLAPDYLDPSMWSEAKIFHCGSVALSQSPCREAQFAAADMAKACGALVSFDPNWRPSVWSDHREARAFIWQMMAMADIVKIAEEEWEFITGTDDVEKGANAIREAGPRLVVVTCGERGAYFSCARAAGEVPGFATQVVDTLGAGDAFVAGMLAEILRCCQLRGTFDRVLQDAPLCEIIQFANACGAIATQTVGAIPALPAREDVEKFLANN